MNSQIDVVKGGSIVEDCVDVRVKEVNEFEIEQLDALFRALQDEHLRNCIKDNAQKKEYVVTINPLNLSMLKKALHVIIPLVTPERIEIDT